MNESSCTGKSEKITIKNDKGRLSEEDIERMVKEAEDFAEQARPLRSLNHLNPECSCVTTQYWLKLPSTQVGGQQLAPSVSV